MQVNTEMKPIILIVFVAFLLGVESLRGQGYHESTNQSRLFLLDSNDSSLNSFRHQENVDTDSAILMIFNDIQKGIVERNIKNISRYLVGEIYVSLHGMETGYFSANHSFYILENFFRARRTVTFKFSSFGELEAAPYATGGGIFSFRGTRELLQIYVSLVKLDQRWVISQFNVY